MKLDSSHEFQLRSMPPEASRTLIRAARAALRPIDSFLHIEAASGIVLLVAAAMALLWANSAWHESYTALWHTRLGFAVGNFSFFRSLEWMVNDGLMVIFFFVVGMEMRREIHHGELSQWRRAAVPVLAALGGMLVPAGSWPRASLASCAQAPLLASAPWYWAGAYCQPSTRKIAHKRPMRPKRHRSCEASQRTTVEHDLWFRRRCVLALAYKPKPH